MISVAQSNSLNADNAFTSTPNRVHQTHMQSSHNTFFSHLSRIGDPTIEIPASHRSVCALLPTAQNTWKQIIIEHICTVRSLVRSGPELYRTPFLFFFFCEFHQPRVRRKKKKIHNKRQLNPTGSCTLCAATHRETLVWRKGLPRWGPPDKFNYYLGLNGARRRWMDGSTDREGQSIVLWRCRNENESRFFSELVFEWW